MSKKKKAQNKNKKVKQAQNSDAVLLANNNQETESEKTQQVQANPEQSVDKNLEKADKNAKKDKNVKNQKNAKGKNAKQKEKGKLRRKTRETIAELKKVTWPSFADVCKKTGTVLVVVLIFAVIIYGIDYCLGLLMNLLRH